MRIAQQATSDSTSGFANRSLPTTVRGPLNRSGIWACTPEPTPDHLPLNTWIGFSRTIHVPFTKTYFIGMAADNEFRFKIDGKTQVKTTNLSNQENFKIWHIYPVTLSAGPHIVEMEGLNVTSYASFGAEIYNNTETELRNATHYKDINNPDDINYVDTLFSTNNMVGQPFETGTYGCPADYALNTSSHDTSKYNCIKSTSHFECRSTATSKAMNPYVQGALGNWRVDSVYAYYGERAENDPAVELDLRTAGAITGYKTFWDPNPQFLTRNYTTAAQAVWPWNSTITQYNRKGYEIENTDPLGRFNSGLYGYNQQLPVAVTNNARVRETMFDGFEDYDYQTGSCTSICKEGRHVNFSEIAGSITTEQKHSGQFSLKINAGQSKEFNAPVVAASSLDQSYGLRIRIDSVAKYDTVIVSQGTDKLSAWNSSGNPCPPTPVLPVSAIEYPYRVFPGGHDNVKWRGKLVPTQTGTYQFRATCDDGFRMSINNTYITTKTGYGTYSLDCDKNYGKVGTLYTGTINLIKGQIYNIEIDTYNWDDNGYFKEFQWKYGCTDWHEIKEGCLYPDNYGTITVNRPSTPSLYCTSLDTVQLRGNAFTDSFSLVQGKKMVIGAWVKEGGNDCKCSTYTKNKIVVTFTGADNRYDLQAAGNIIEGWQRYEAVIDIPATATSVKVNLENHTDNNAPVYFDDVRMHPFNANMKSFVYHSSNLRLMAELDENNYASFYEYDDDGTLTRVKKETIAGIKTITETRSALQKAVD